MRKSFSVFLAFGVGLTGASFAHATEPVTFKKVGTNVVASQCDVAFKANTKVTYKIGSGLESPGKMVAVQSKFCATAEIFFSNLKVGSIVSLNVGGVVTSATYTGREDAPQVQPPPLPPEAQKKPVEQSPVKPPSEVKPPPLPPEAQKKPDPPVVPAKPVEPTKPITPPKPVEQPKPVESKQNIVGQEQTKVERVIVNVPTPVLIDLPDQEVERLAADSAQRMATAYFRRFLAPLMFESALQRRMSEVNLAQLDQSEFDRGVREAQLDGGAKSEEVGRLAGERDSRRRATIDVESQTIQALKSGASTPPSHFELTGAIPENSGFSSDQATPRSLQSRFEATKKVFLENLTSWIKAESEDLTQNRNSVFLSPSWSKVQNANSLELLIPNRNAPPTNQFGLGFTANVTGSDLFNIWLNNDMLLPEASTVQVYRSITDARNYLHADRNMSRFQSTFANEVAIAIGDLTSRRLRMDVDRNLADQLISQYQIQVREYSHEAGLKKGRDEAFDKNARVAYAKSYASTYVQAANEASQKLMQSSQIVDGKLTILNFSERPDLAVGDYLNVRVSELKNIGGQAFRGAIQVRAQVDGQPLALRSSNPLDEVTTPGFGVQREATEINRALQIPTTVQPGQKVIVQVAVSGTDVTTSATFEVSWEATVRKLMNPSQDVESQEAILQYVSLQLKKEYESLGGANWHTAYTAEDHNTLLERLAKVVKSSTDDQKENFKLLYVSHLKEVFGEEPSWAGTWNDDWTAAMAVFKDMLKD